MIYRFTYKGKTYSLLKINNWTIQFDRDLMEALDDCWDLTNLWKTLVPLLEEKGWDISPVIIRNVELS